VQAERQSPEHFAAALGDAILETIGRARRV
jgi:hypothetical protein